MASQTSPSTIAYCEVCTLPYEYCEFGPSAELCKKNCRENHPGLYERYYGALEEAKEEDPAALAADEAKLKGKGGGGKKGKKEQDMRVYIKRSERNRRKCVTTVCNLQTYDVELKKAAKLFANRFACGSSVSKNPQGIDDIVVQGDVSDELLQLITSTWKNVPEKMIELVEEKKKKK
ncbi:translation initiation factor SUI1 [Piptocephalis cylindrospora]|uniref:Translation machinery-associated protein 22 n=1 Tax=Piptocephalis cylindrospora TaxID=1907219 RepID=A0A4P9Y0A8_9FUNG|nr:translation initiation factor SUI1 [Piptocephalis cylindrospora]|eukprot:RKP12175.1 translation initiation factor SUI1 [Piptocephalis cylindrospora]